ncbi:hypothetical protein ACWIGI_29110 [Nocardia sp. NPDC055321]
MRHSVRLAVVGAVAVAALTTGATTATAETGVNGSGAVGAGSAELSTGSGQLVYKILVALGIYPANPGCPFPPSMCG